MLRFKINHSSRSKEITHWVNFIGNKVEEIKELGSRNEEKRKRKKKMMRSPKNWDPKTHEGKKGFKIHEAKEGPSRPKSVSRKKPNRENWAEIPETARAWDAQHSRNKSKTAMKDKRVSST